jgi:hypothetical protein
MCDPQRLKQLEDENRKLTDANGHLKAELDFLKMHPVFVAGLKGENASMRLSWRHTNLFRRKL